MAIILNGTSGIITPGITNTGPFIFEGPVTVPAGSASSPSVSFTGSTNTGLYLSATGAVSISTAGTQRVVVSASGDVGIGASSPAYKLDVNGAVQSSVASGNGSFYVNNSSLTGKFWAFIPETSSGESNFLWYYGGTSAGTRMTLTNTGNLGLGVTPSAWWSGGKVIQVGVGTSVVDTTTQALFGHNWYYDGTNVKYIANGFASYIEQTSGQHRWYTAGSGTAGNNITFTQAMTLTAAGNLGIGTASPSNYAGYATISLNNATNGGAIEFLKNGTVQGQCYADGSTMVVGSSVSIPLTFKTSNAERARITDGGNFLVGKTSAGGTGGIEIVPNVSSLGFGRIILNSGYNAAANSVLFEYSGSQVGYIQQTTTATSYNTSSDRRLKENIVSADDAGSVIDAIQIVKHDWKVGGHTRYGVIAQDLYSVAPEAVSVGDADDVEEFKNPWGVDYSKLVPMLVKEIQSLRARLAAAGI